MTFPSPPWHMNAQMWLSVFRVPEGHGREPGLYGAAFVSYEQGSPLTYQELVSARLLDVRRRRVRITDIWVDSAASLEGGRSLWAIPKQLAKLEVDDHRVGPASHTTLAGHVDGRPVASAQFAAMPGAALLRTPISALTSQLRDDTGREVVTPMTGSARTLPALASWDVAPDGPLGYLHGRRPLVSMRLTDLRLTFG